MFSHTFNLKQTLEQATRKYDDHLNDINIIASCSYNVITDSETGAIKSLKIGAPSFVLEQFKEFLVEKSISYHYVGNPLEYLTLDHTEFESKNLTSADQKAFLEKIDKALNPGILSYCLVM